MRIKKTQSMYPSYIRWLAMFFISPVTVLGSLSAFADHNLAHNLPVASLTASSEYVHSNASYGERVLAVDGNESTFWQVNKGGNAWFKATLAASSSVSQVTITTQYQQASNTYTLYTSPDNLNFTNHGALTSSPSQTYTWDFSSSPVAHVQHVRINITSTGSGWYPSIRELQVFGTAGGGSAEVLPVVWNARYNGPNNITDSPVKVITDASDNVYVLAASDKSKTGVNFDFVTMKYNANGALQWQVRYDNGVIGGTGDVPYDISVDSSGNVYVVGSSCLIPVTAVGPQCKNSESVTLKYNSLGNQQWKRTHNTGVDAYLVENNNSATNILLGQDGYIYVAGESNQTTTGGDHPSDFILIKYDASGNEVWLREPGLEVVVPEVIALAMDQTNTIYLIIARMNKDGPIDYRVIKYNTAGDQTTALITDDRFDAATIDSAGNIYTTGRSKNVLTNPNGFYTYKYDTNGNQLWSAYYSMNGLTDNPTAIALDSSGNVYVTGESYQGSSGTSPDNSLDYATVKYNNNGIQQWGSRYTRGSGNTPTYLVIDGAGNSYVTGRSHNGINNDFATVKYDTLGNQVWEMRYDYAGTDATVFPLSLYHGDAGLSLALDSNGKLLVTGSSQGLAGDLDVATIKYDTAYPQSPLPDLSVSALSTTTTQIAPGSMLDMTNAVLNSGTVKAGSFVISFHLSVDSVYGGTDDIAFDYRTVPFDGQPASWRAVSSIGAGQSSSYVSSLKIPASTPESIYYICAKADVYDSNAENAENNNTACTATNLVISSMIPNVASLSPAQVIYGVDSSQPITITGANFVNGATITVGPTSGATVPGAVASAAVPFVYVNSTTLSFWWNDTVLGLGSYTVEVSNPSTVGNLVDSLTNGFKVNDNTSRLTNISTRAYVGAGANATIAGFIISGTSPKQVLIRARGPSLTNFGLTGVLANPTVELYSFNAGRIIAKNNTWSSAIAVATPGNLASYTADSCETAFSCVAPPDPCSAAPAFAGANCSAEGSLLITLPPGTYTATETGISGSVGVGLIEVNETDSTPGSSRLINISTRAYVGTGVNATIAGFIISGTSPKQVLIRARGPSLTNFGLTGVLANPTVELYSFNAVRIIAKNDTWSNAIAVATPGNLASYTANSCEASFACIAPPDPCLAAPAFAGANCSAESSLLITLPPGAYTATETGVGGSEGIGLIEVNETGP